MEGLRLLLFRLSARVQNDPQNQRTFPPKEEGQLRAVDPCRPGPSVSPEAPLTSPDSPWLWTQLSLAPISPFWVWDRQVDRLMPQMRP